MHSRFRAKGVALAVLAALTALLALPGTSLAKPKPGVPGRGFRLQARAIGAITINRIYCGLAATGEVCVDSTNSSTIGGGYWPKGSPQQYVFNSGLQAAGAIDTAGGWAWAGDTTGAFFFDPKGTTQHGQLVQPIWNSSSPSDVASWPAAAYVPQGDQTADLFYPSLQGQVSASQGDVWTVAWDGDPSLIAGRPHPLGIAVETRGLGWNFPTYNNDVVYFIYTFYNISASGTACPAAYAGMRPAMQDLLKPLGDQFQALNNAAFGITIPACGYTIKDFYANFAADMDVSSDAGNNYSSVNLPFQLGYVYEDSFRGPEGTYVLPPDAGSAPFTGGYGFVGVKYLSSPIDPNTLQQAGLRLFSNTVNGSSFNDPQNVQQMYRYISGNISPALGDGLCNYDPTADKICFVKSDGHADMRFFQSSGPFDLPAGAYGSIVVGYVFASPVAVAGCPTPGCPSVTPGDPTRLSNASNLASLGANLVDSLTGFAGYSDVNGDTEVQQGEFVTVKGSLLGKSLVAQSVFDNKFLLPQAPAAPEFFVVPGNNSVAVFWRPSATETTGDLYYSAASSPGTPSVPNTLYDPNYRQLDVEGYRIYRGRVDDPSALALLAQYDYAGTTMSDYLGALNPVAGCAPELGVQAQCTDPSADVDEDGSPDAITFDTPGPGVAYNAFATIDVVSPLIQVKLGDRALLADGNAILLAADTAITGSESGNNPGMEDTGVPFVYVDATAKNNIRYFYAVTAFDVNSIQSGPTSLESARITKSTTPVAPGSNYDNVGTLSIGIFGRGVNMSEAIPKAPGINSATGMFTGPARPATGASIGFVGDFVKQVVTQSGALSVTLDSLRLGTVYGDNACAVSIGTPNTYYLTVSSNFITSHTVLSVQTDCGGARVSANGTIDGGPLDNERASRYGGSDAYHVMGSYSMTYTGVYNLTMQGRRCANSGSENCDYNGARWFSGANESYAHPTRGNVGLINVTGATPTNPTNAGSLPGILNVNEPRGYSYVKTSWRGVEAGLSGAARAADFKVYWGAAGVVDSVIDVTHNVPVKFRADTMEATWGFLNAGAQGGGNSNDGTTDVTPYDFLCVPPLRANAAAQGAGGCTAPSPYVLSQTAVPGPMRYLTNNVLTPAANPGWGMYIAGHTFLFELAPAAAVPAAGTVWTLRTYVGHIVGGGGSAGSAGNDGAYSFVAEPSPFTAVGATLAAQYSVTNAPRPATESDLDAVHTVPDPYYVTNAFESSPSGKVIKFVNLPFQSIIRIYSTSGVLVRVLEHNSSQFGGEESWDVRNRNNQVVASGVYFYAIEAPSGARRVGRMTIVNFAQ